jgi:SAM-dependent methyltransferase
VANKAFESFYDEMTEVYNPPNTRRHFLEDDRYGNLVEFVNRGSARQRILDAGCGNGWVASLYGEGHEVVGTDISEINLEKMAALGIRPVKHDLDEPFPFDDATYDTVVCTEVLEHVFEPDRLLREIFRVLKPGGRVILTVPNLHGLRNRMNMLFGTFTPFIEFGIYTDKHDQLSHVGVQHIRHYSRRGMGAVLRTIGFENLEHRGQSFHLNCELPYRLLSLAHGGNRGLRLILRIVSLGRIREEYPGLVVRLWVTRLLGRLFPTLAAGMLYQAFKPNR